MAQMVKNLPAMRVTGVRSLGWEDPLEEGMATHPSILAFRSPWGEKPGRLQSTGSQRVRHSWVTKHSIAGNLARHRHAHTPYTHPLGPFSLMGSIAGGFLLHLWCPSSVRSYVVTVFLLPLIHVTWKEE